MITVSVIMTTYNQARFIAEAINGVLRQECDFEVELILADDNSPDNTDEIVNEFIKNHPKRNRVKYTKHVKNKGMINNGVWALKQCKGKYIALCEGDDYWTDPLKLQKQVTFLERNQEYGLVFTDFDIYYDKAKVYRLNIFKEKLMPLYYTFEEHLVNAGFLAPCTWLCRKELVPNIEGNCVDGTYFWMLHVMANSKIKFLKDTTTVYRVLEESASRSFSLEKRYDFSYGIFEIKQEFYEIYDVSEKIKGKIKRDIYLDLFPLGSILRKSSFLMEVNFFWKKNRKTIKEKLFYQISSLTISYSIFKILFWLKRVIKFKREKEKNSIWIAPTSNKSGLI